MAAAPYIKSPLPGSASNTRVNALMTPQVGFTVAPALAMLQLS